MHFFHLKAIRTIRIALKVYPMILRDFLGIRCVWKQVSAGIALSWPRFSGSVSFRSWLAAVWLTCDAILSLVFHSETKSALFVARPVLWTANNKSNNVLAPPCSLLSWYCSLYLIMCMYINIDRGRGVSCKFQKFQWHFETYRIKSPKVTYVLRPSVGLKGFGFRRQNDCEKTAKKCEKINNNNNKWIGQVRLFFTDRWAFGTVSFESQYPD